MEAEGDAGDVEGRAEMGVEMEVEAEGRQGREGPKVRLHLGAVRFLV